MGKGALATGIALALTLALTCATNAQTPYIAVYFDSGLSDLGMDCPGFMVDTLYVGGVNFNTMVTGTEFAITYPPAVLWMADLNVPPVTIGQTINGISMGYGVPLNGFSPLELCRVIVFWNCDHCDQPYIENPINVVAHPFTGFLGWTDLTFTERPAVGLTSKVCPFASPVEETTWGRVKSLYAE
jgi:hypothetical protein